MANGYLQLAQTTSPPAEPGTVTPPTTPAPAADSSGWDDIGFWGIVILVAAAVLVFAYVMRRRRRR